MTDPRPTTTLATSTSNRLDGDTQGTEHGRDLAAAMIGVAAAALRHAVEDTDASSRAQSRARAALRSVVARFDDAPHAADLIIGELAPTSREITLARANVDAMASLAEARAHGVAMMLEAGVSTMRGRIGVALGARLVAVAESSIESDPKTAAYVVGAGLAAIDRAVEADRTTRAEQRDEAARRDWAERSKAITVVDAEPLQSVDVDVSELAIGERSPIDDPIERAAATVQALQAKKASILGGSAFADPRDDEIRIRPPSKPSPEAAKSALRSARSAKGTSPFDRGAQLTRKATPAELAARGIFTDSAIEPHALAVAEAERQQAERTAREREFPKGIGRLTGNVAEWKPLPRPEEPAGWQQLHAMRNAQQVRMLGEHDHDEHDDEEENES